MRTKPQTRMTLSSRDPRAFDVFRSLAREECAIGSFASESDAIIYSFIDMHRPRTKEANRYFELIYAERLPVKEVLWMVFEDATMSPLSLIGRERGDILVKAAMEICAVNSWKSRVNVDKGSEGWPYAEEAFRRFAEYLGQLAEEGGRNLELELLAKYAGELCDEVTRDGYPSPLTPILSLVSDSWEHVKSTKMVYKLLLAVMDASEGWPDQAPGDNIDGFAIDAASAEARKILLSALDRFYESKDDKDAGEEGVR